MKTKQVSAVLVVLSSSVIVSGCTGFMGGLSENAPQVSESTIGRLGEDLRVVTVFDTEGEHQAVGVVPVEEQDIAEGAGADAPVLLAIVRRGTDEAQFPIGDTRVVDAALGSRDGEAAYIMEDGRLCLTRAEQEPACRSVLAVPAGMDVAPDGRVVFVADTGTGTNVRVLDPRSRSGPRRLTFGVGYRNRPLFDPSGTQVLYVGSSSEGIASLFTVSADGGESQQLTNVGLRLGAVGSQDRLPVGVVPPPVDRESMRWDAVGIRFESSQGTWNVDPTSGEAEEEVLQ